MRMREVIFVFVGMLAAVCIICGWATVRLYRQTWVSEIPVYLGSTFLALIVTIPQLARQLDAHHGTEPGMIAQTPALLLVGVYLLSVFTTTIVAWYYDRHVAVRVESRASARTR